ncbi:MAG TPA: DegT/DnrJ/EryC1/StrS family aminotransferase [Thermoanaerobaculia bacterium]|nr:DegT/DnrJ/EryC1/StrS family aminotransferase [Thermoanaerobaculia bacterium]
MIECLSLPSDQDASGRSFGEEEMEMLAAVLRSGILTSTKGTVVRALEEGFADTLGVPYAWACSSGTAAFHTAVAAIDPEPGDEIVTSPITDMGALTPILYQGAIPVFADVDPATCNVTAATIERSLSERTRAIVVTHLFGNPCDMAPILALARSRGIPLIEDCAQAFLARDRGRSVGTMGTIGVFSLQQGKHVTCGEGGLVVTRDEALARRMFLFINKAWGYGDPCPDHTFLALNYRLSELQGAVAYAQLPRLGELVERRIANAARLTAAIGHLPGIAGPVVRPRSVHAYWRYGLRVDPVAVPGGAVALGALLKRRGIAAAPRYIQKPAFECEVFQHQRTFGESRWPFTLARPEALDFRRGRFPGVYEALDSVLVLPWNERFEREHVDFLAESIHEAVGRLAREAA